MTLEINDRVRLKIDKPDDMYPFACVGSEGWIRKRIEDSAGFPMVWVEWDKLHWAYNGEEDKWTFENHFEKVEDSEVSENLSNEELLKKLAKDMGYSLSKEENKNDDGQFIQSLTEAREILGQEEIDGFMLLVLTPVERDGIPTFNLSVVSDFKGEDAQLSLGASLTKIADDSYLSLLGKYLKVRDK